MSDIVNINQLDLKNGRYSYADYLTWKFEQMVELIKGRILPLAAPSRRHQDISREISGAFYQYFKSQECKFYAAPFDVRLVDKKKSVKENQDVTTVVQPDLCVVCDLKKLDEKGCFGAPDLVVEILSPGNSAKEMKVKKDLYEENQIREYWIFDPEHETVFQFSLNENNCFSPATILINEEILTSVIFPDLSINLKEVFTEMQN